MEDRPCSQKRNIEKQTVLSYWRAQSRARKIKEGASQKNQARETGRGGHRVK